MKNKFIKVTSLLIPLGFILLVTGCGKYSEKDLLKDLDKKITKTDAYHLKGNLEITNNDDVYNYKVEVSYKKKDKYKVSLKNTANNHEQIILRNDEGVYILNPSLNKSFKFQSDWPYNNSQIYLLESVLNDIKNDKNRTFKKTDKGYNYVTTVNYPNNKKLIKQKIQINKNLKFKKIDVLNEDNIPQLTMEFTKVDYNPTFNKNYFDLNEIMKSAEVKEDVKTTSSLDETIYPLVLPNGTKLTNEEKVQKESGERIIMTFEGDKSFLLVEETSTKEDEFTVIPTLGEPYQLMDTYGVMTDDSLTWSSNGIDYYIVSDVMNQDELIEVASSISAIPTMK